MGPIQQITITVNGLKALVSYFRPHQPPHAHYHRRHRPCIHNYILMQKDRAFLYMSELDIPPWFVTLLKSKAHSPVAWGDVVLKAAKLTAEMGVDTVIVGSAHVDAEETIKAAVDLGEELVKRKRKGQMYRENRKMVFAEVLVALRFDESAAASDDESHADSVAKTLKSKL